MTCLRYAKFLNLKSETRINDEIELAKKNEEIPGTATVSSVEAKQKQPVQCETGMGKQIHEQFFFNTNILYI